MVFSNLLFRVGTILEKSPVKKSMVIANFLLALFAYYLLCDLVLIIWQPPYINHSVILAMFYAKLLFVTVAQTAIKLRHRINQSNRAQQIIPYAVTHFYLITLMVLGYCVGHLSFITGVVMAATPLLCMILFDDAVTLALVVSGLCSYTLINVLYVLGVIPAAPLFIMDSNPDLYARMFYVGATLVFSLPHMIAFLCGTYLMVRYWQSREDGVRRAGLTDSLTNLANRRAISEHLAHLVATRTDTSPISVILVDIDFFKKVNDTYGHATGDVVLRRVGATLKGALRGTDQVGRYGGEEFLIVLPKTSLISARQVAERCRLQIEQEVILSTNQTAIYVTASFGIYCSVENSEDVSRILHDADTQLYRAKESGRNRVCSHDEAIVA